MLPQVIKLATSKSWEGLVPEMFYVDNFMMIIVGWYNVHLKNPFSVYGENFFILAQDVAIVLLIWTYNKEVKTITKIIVSISVSGLFLILYTDILVSENMWTLMINIQFVLLTIARTPQIWHNFKNQSTGQLAIITYALNSLGGIARTLTLLKETTDFLNILVTLLSLLFNATLAFQIVYYWNSPSKTINKIKDNTDEPIIVKKPNGSIPEKRAKTIID